MKTNDANSQDLSKVFEVQANFPFSFSNFWCSFSVAYLAVEADDYKKGTKDSFNLPEKVNQTLRGMFQKDSVSIEFPDTGKKTFIKFNSKANMYNMITIDTRYSMILDTAVFGKSSWDNEIYLIGRYLASNHSELHASF